MKSKVSRGKRAGGQMRKISDTEDLTLDQKVLAFVPVFAREVFFETYARLMSMPYADKLRFLVCDNGNAEELSKRLATLESSTCHVIRLQKNVGGAGAFAACWEAAKEWFTDVPYIWMLDDDAEPSDNTVPVLVREFNHLSQQGIKVGGVCTANVGKECGLIMECGSDENWQYKPFVQHCRGEKINIRKGKTFQVGYGPAASHLTKREILEEVGFFEKDIFLHFDDIDWCLRVRDAGYKMYATSKAYFVHPEPKFTPRWVIYYDVRNYLWCAWRHGKSGVFHALRAQLPILLRIRMHLPKQFVCYEWMGLVDFLRNRRKMRNELPAPIPPTPLDIKKDIPASIKHFVVISRDSAMVDAVSRFLNRPRTSFHVVVYRTQRPKYISLLWAIIKQLMFQIRYCKNTMVVMDERCISFWMLPFRARFRVFSSFDSGLYDYKV